MAQITRYNGNVKPFADDALGTERTIFGGTTQSDTLNDNINNDFLRGWGIVGANEKPTKQDFNAFAYTSTALTSYLFQMGVPEWNASQEYFTGSITNVAGVLYRAVRNNTGQNPTTDTGDDWLAVAGDGFDISGLTTATIASNDFICFQDVSDSNNMKRSLVSNLLTLLSTPSGVVEYFAGTSVPTGYLLCDGSAVSRTTYAALFSAIGTTHGSGDGSTTFNLPNEVTSNRFRRASGGSLSVGNTQSDNVGSFSASTTLQGQFTSWDAGATPPAGSTGNKIGAGVSASLSQASTTTSYSISGGSGETRPDNIAYLPVIKF